MKLRKISRNEKKGMVANQIVIAIIVLIVVAVVLLFIFRVRIIEYIKALPSFKVSEEDVEMEDVTKDESAIDQYPVKVGRIIEGGKVGGDPIHFCGDSSCSEANLIETKIKINFRTRKVEVKQLWDDAIGTIDGEGLITLYDWVFERSGDDYEEVKDELLYEEYERNLISLDGAVLFSNNEINRKTEIVKLGVGDKIDLENLPLNWVELEIENIIIAESYLAFNDGFGYKIAVNRDNLEIINPNSNVYNDFAWAEVQVIVENE